MRVATDRLEINVIQSGPADGVPVVLLHGNLSTGRFFEHLFDVAPKRYRLLAPDMRGFGDTENAADRRDPRPARLGRRHRRAAAALDITAPPHLVGWSTGGAAIAAFALERPVASLTFIDPVGPYGYGATKLDGTPHYDDYAGCGGGAGNPDFAARIAAGDTSSEGDLAPRNVLNSSYWRADHREPPEREDMLVGEILKSVTGDDGYPGDTSTSEHWPGIAPGTRGILNALSPKYCNWADIVDARTRSRRSCGRTARRTSSSPTARRGSWARSGPWAWSRAGRARRRSHRSRWWPRSARSWRTTRRAVGASRPSGSRSPATSRRWTRRSAGTRASSGSWSRFDVRRCRGS